MKIAKLFQNGQSQAVRLPKEFRFEGNDVFVKKVGKVIVLLPRNNPWESLLDSLNQFSDDFLETRDQPNQPEREDLFS